MATEESKLTSMNVSLSEELRDWVGDQLENRGYSTVSEYVRELIREDRRRELRAALEKRLLEALESPKSEMTAEDWTELRATVTRCVTERNGE